MPPWFRSWFGSSTMGGVSETLRWVIPNSLRAVFSSTVLFHEPVFADRWGQPEPTDELEAVI